LTIPRWVRLTIARWVRLTITGRIRLPAPAPTRPTLPPIKVNPGDLLDGVGGAVDETLETGTQLPGQILGGNGG
ncbi:hypothetical protein, partial [Nocardia sp. NPDC003354]